MIIRDILEMDLSPLLFHSSSPSLSTVEKRNHGLVCVSESDVDRVGKAWKVRCVVLSGRSYKVFVLPKKEREPTPPSFDWNVLLYIRLTWISPSIDRVFMEMSASYSARTSAHSIREVLVSSCRSSISLIQFDSTRI